MAKAAVPHADELLLDESASALESAQIAKAEQVHQLVELTTRISKLKERVSGSDSMHVTQAIDTTTREQMEKEASAGTATFVLRADAYGNKVMVRELEVVLVLIREQPSGGKILMELSRDTGKQSQCRLPGRKKQTKDPIESTTRHVIEQEIGLEPHTIMMSYKDIESFSEEGASVSVGFHTVYNFRIVPGYLTNVDEALKARIGLNKEGAIWTAGAANSEKPRFFTWMSEKQSQSMKVKLRGDKKDIYDAVSFKPSKEIAIHASIADLSKKVQTIYQRERLFVNFERGTRQVTDFLQAEHSSVHSIVQRDAARRSYVLKHAARAREFADTLSEIEKLTPHINPPHLEDLPMLDERLRRLEAGSALIADSSSRLHGHVAKLAHDYHNAIVGLNAQMLSWSRLLDDHCEGVA
jgi:hypothetical protein